MKKVGVISLGCDKNRVDTENMLYYLQQSQGYEITQKIEEADAIIVNTCAFIQSAREEAIDTILQAAENHPKKLIVTGCLPQKYIDDIFDDLPEVDAFLGTASYQNIVSVLDDVFARDCRVNAVEKQAHAEAPEKRVLTTPYHYGYLKIAEGCDNHCTYCTIPSIRGKYVSRSLEELLSEAESLAAEGVKELILVAQDTTNYGADLYGKPMLVPLIQSLSKIEGIEWIRLLYCYPERVDAALVEELANNPKLAKYIDIPLQHISSTVLKRMGRKTTRARIESLLKELKTKVPGICIRSTFIVGFPGETEEAFAELTEFLRTEKLTNAGFFAYSKEEDTPAAKLKDQISEEVKTGRQRVCYEMQAEVSRENNAEYAGKTVTVLCDGVDFDRGVLFGHTEGMAPDVDGIVKLHSGNTLNAGIFYSVKITDYDEYDLEGDVL